MEIHRVLLFFLLASLPSISEMRVWTNSSNGNQFEGVFISADKETAKIKRKKDNRIFTIPLNSLILKDKRFIELKKTQKSVEFDLKNVETYEVEVTLSLKVSEKLEGKEIYVQIAEPFSDQTFLKTQNQISPTEIKVSGISGVQEKWNSVSKVGSIHKWISQKDNRGHINVATFSEGMREGDKPTVKVKYTLEVGSMKYPNELKSISMSTLLNASEGVPGCFVNTESDTWDAVPFLEKILGAKEKYLGRSIYKNMELLYDGVVEHMDYTYPVPFDTLSGILKSGKGDCFSYVWLISALAAEVNIPCRVLCGYALNLNDEVHQDAGLHCWGEFFVPEYGWVPFDGSFGEDNPKAYFGQLKEKNTCRIVNSIEGEQDSGIQSFGLSYKLGEELNWLELDEDYTLSVEIQKYRPH